MINSSEAIQSLSSSSDEGLLEEIFEEMTGTVEFDFDVSVEFTYGNNSYWVPTPDYEIEELELFGIIEIGDEQTMFGKLISLTHEIGHCILDLEETYKDIDCVLFTESVAWYLGYNYMVSKGYRLDPSEYKEETKYAIELYRRSENARDVK